MHTFAIGDLHLSGANPKAMDVFGPQWTNHFERIRSDWEKKVSSDDVVLIVGDISWATRLAEAIPDLEAIGSLPGRKIMVRGNHDYWWSAPAKVRSALPTGVEIIQNDAIKVGPIVFCGTRGWTFPMGSPLTEEDEKIFQREKIRLRLSLDAAKRLNGERIIVALHYPPLYENWQRTDFTDILEEYHVDHVVFGHLHGEILRQVHLREYTIRGITYDLVSADYLNFGIFELL